MRVLLDTLNLTLLYSSSAAEFCLVDETSLCFYLCPTRLLSDAGPPLRPLPRSATGYGHLLDLSFQACIHLQYHKRQLPLWSGQ